MNYKKIYDLLCERARNRKREGYTETHHVIPKCLGGLNDSDNLVELTAEEHFLAHQLLVKMYPTNHKLAFAALMMTVENDRYDGARIHNKRYGWLKRKQAQAISKVHKGKILSESTKQKMRGKRPHVNQTGARNNNAKGIKTPYGVFGSISECLRTIGDTIDYSDKRYYISKLLNNPNSGWSVV